MMITRDLCLLCLVAWLLAGTAASLAARRAERRGVAARQAEALDELIFDAANYRLRRQPQQNKNKNKQPHEVAAAAAAAALHPQDGSKEGDKIVALPGQSQSNNSVDFDQYGGYVTVDAKHGRALFYYFAEAARSADPSSRPLLLWLNGGPGCSSIGYGAMEELGPFRVMSDGKTLYRNPFAWNKVANVLFLESPAGVGFSYSNTSDDYERSGDRRTAEDAYAFLVNWMERFPEYKGRDFFIAGESYAGHYVPQLAQTILYRNNTNKDQAAGRENIATINLKGVMMGNAVINDETDTRGMYDYFWTHALISDEAIGAIHKSCNFSADNGDQSQRCLQGLESIQLGDLDIYNIYAPLCLSPGVADSQHPKRPSINNFDPCTDAYVNAYLNDPKVQEALHANLTKLNYPWSACSQVITEWQDSPSTILPIIRELLSSGIQVWIYSGDVDGRVPVTSTRYSINQLKLPVKTPWKPWSVDDEVGGYSVIYGDGNLTFVTVRGAGHEVPSYQPLRALVLLQSFLLGKQLPAS